MLTATLTVFALLGSGGDDNKNGGPAKVVIKCRADAEIRGTQVQLRDLAEVQGADSALVERLLSISFGRRPAMGFSRVLSRQDIMLRLTSQGLRSNRISMTGARDVVLHPLMTRVPASELLDVAQPVLRSVLDAEGGDVEFEPSGKISPITVPPGRYSFDLRPELAGGRLTHTAAMVNVTITVDNEDFKVVRIPFRLRRYQKVLVASRAIRRGDQLDRQNIELKRVEASQGTSPFLQSFDAVYGKVAARDLQVGQRLTLPAATDPAVVFKGDSVNLVAIKGSIQIATRAMALEDGAVGQRIAVRNLTARRIVQAVVKGRGLVVVRPGSTRGVIR